MSSKAARIRLGPSDSHEHAQRIAEYVSEAWYGRHGSGGLEIPVSVVAALSLVSPPYEHPVTLDPPYEARAALARELISTSPEEFGHCILGLWKGFMRSRPDLINRVWPLVEPWVATEDYGRYPVMTKETLGAAKAVGRAALLSDLLSFTSDKREDADLLGSVLTELRPKSALQGRGQFYTPAAVTEVMAHLLGAPDEGESVNDPACGTGGMFRGAAMAMRQVGRDPATVTWVGNDVDGLAVACCAVNVVLWGLGFKVLLGVANTLTEPDWEIRARGERRETVTLMRDLTLLGLIRDLGTAVVDVADPQVTDQQDAVGDQADSPAAPDAEPADTAPGVEPDGEEVEADLEPLELVEPPQLTPLVGGFWDLVDAVADDEKTA